MNRQKKSLKPLLVYLGYRGGGLQLLLDTTYSLSKNGVKHFLIVSKAHQVRFEEIGLYAPSVTYIELPHTFRELTSLRSFGKNVIELLKLCKFAYNLRSRLIVHIMPSPFDFLIDVVTSKKTNIIVRCIHDASPHLGEKWPTKRSIESRVKFADYLVFFSVYVSDKIEFNDASKRVVTLPKQFHRYGTLGFEVQSLISELNDSTKVTYLCVGRIQEYKGVNLIESISSFVLKTNFILAGAGITRYKVPQEAKRISRWLSDAEFQDLIQAADVLVFPYLESTQSGTIPIGIHENKCILVADIGGLSEQIRGYPKGFMFESGNSLSFLNALEGIQAQFESGELNLKFYISQELGNTLSVADVVEELIVIN